MEAEVGLETEGQSNASGECCSEATVEAGARSISDLPRFQDASPENARARGGGGLPYPASRGRQEEECTSMSSSTSASIGIDRSTKRVRGRGCAERGCTKRATFGPPGGGAVTCSQHKQPGAIDVWHKRCERPNCDRHPHFGFPGGPAQFCKEHITSSEMIDVRHVKCSFPGCKKRVKRSTRRSKVAGKSINIKNFCPVHENCLETTEYRGSSTFNAAAKGRQGSFELSKPADGGHASTLAELQQGYGQMQHIDWLYEHHTHPQQQQHLAAPQGYHEQFRWLPGAIPSATHTSFAHVDYDSQVALQGLKSDSAPKNEGTTRATRESSSLNTTSQFILPHAATTYEILDQIIGNSASVEKVPLSSPYSSGNPFAVRRAYLSGERGTTSFPHDQSPPQDRKSSIFHQYDVPGGSARLVPDMGTNDQSAYGYYLPPPSPPPSPPQGSAGSG